MIGLSSCHTQALAPGIVVLGDPVAPAKGGVLFPALPGARREAINVARQFGVTPQPGADAVRDAVLAADGKAEIIHIAAHGVANSNSPLDSYIALSDGPWTAGSIQRTCLSGTRIVIPSACQTGLFSPRWGESGAFAELQMQQSFSFGSARQCTREAGEPTC